MPGLGRRFQPGRFRQQSRQAATGQDHHGTRTTARTGSYQDIGHGHEVREKLKELRSSRRRRRTTFPPRQRKNSRKTSVLRFATALYPRVHPIFAECALEYATRAARARTSRRRTVERRSSVGRDMLHGPLLVSVDERQATRRETYALVGKRGN